MTDEQTVYRLTGWLRLVPGDCVGIAVFTDGSNMQFLPETDDRLRILEFNAFFNEEGYAIERRLPPGADVRVSRGRNSSSKVYTRPSSSRPPYIRATGSNSSNGPRSKPWHCRTTRASSFEPNSS
jgi:hypothetical protein